MTEQPLLNSTVLMTDPGHIGIAGINAYEDISHGPNYQAAQTQFLQIKEAVTQAGIKVHQIASPPDCQDGVYTANWAVTYNGKALLAKLPNARESEEPYAKKQLESLGFDCRQPADYFSGQGDLLLFNDHEAIVGHGYRTKLTPGLRSDLAWLGIAPIFLQALPQLDAQGQPQINRVTGLTDSYYYDMDLAVAVIAPNVLAVCLDALTPASQITIEKLASRSTDPIKIIEVTETEARDGFGCNLLSTGHTVVMSDAAPNLTASLRRQGYQVITTSLDQFKLTGGGIRCVTLTLNQ